MIGIGRQWLQAATRRPGSHSRVLGRPPGKTAVRWFETSLGSETDGVVNFQGVVQRRFREFEGVSFGVREQPYGCLRTPETLFRNGECGLPRRHALTLWPPTPDGETPAALASGVLRKPEGVSKSAAFCSGSPKESGTASLVVNGRPVSTRMPVERRGGRVRRNGLDRESPDRQRLFLGASGTHSGIDSDTPGTS